MPKPKCRNNFEFRSPNMDIATETLRTQSFLLFLSSRAKLSGDAKSREWQIPKHEIRNRE